MTCPHYHIYIVRTFDLKKELAICEDCGEGVPNWASRHHVMGKQHYRYGFTDPRYFPSRKGATNSGERTT